MADALCGPSNPLQAFQKQAGLDRTLQQDRVVHSGNSLESFRNAANHATSLDSQFEAFHNPTRFGGAPLQNIKDSISRQDNQAILRQQSLGPPPAQPSWIAEFSRLHLPQTPNAHHSAGLNFESRLSQTRQDTRASAYQGGPENRTHLRDQAILPYQNLNHLSAGHTGLWAKPSPFSDGQSVPGAVSAFDESAFQAAFDAAEEQSFVHRPDGVESEAQRQVIPGDRGQLALLQYNILANVIDPTEQNIHRAALFMSLLEQYDQSSLDSGEAATLRAIMSHIEDNPRAVSYFARYDLQERAARYRQGCQGSALRPSLGLQSSQANLLECFRECMKAQVDQPMHDLDASTTVATDPEMQADLAMQLRRLNEMPKQDRILQAISDNLTTASDSSIQTALGTVWQSERTLLQQVPGALERLDAQLQSLSPQARHVFDPPQQRLAATSSIRTSPSTIATDQQAQQNKPTAQQRDELAQTASDLLDKVAHDQSEKFKNSTFLDLMRKLKHREVQVEGDQMVAKDPQDHAHTAQAPLTQAPIGPMPVSRSVMADRVSGQAWPQSTTQDQPIDGQAVIDLLNEPSFQPVDTAPADSLAERLYDELDAELSQDLFDA